MSLLPTRIGSYEVTARIAVGGMGEVYRATDTRLKRQVALKILPAAVSADPDRRARFQREAEVLASLNHPNIAQIYGLIDAGSADGSAAPGPREAAPDAAPGLRMDERPNAGRVPSSKSDRDRRRPELAKRARPIAIG
jgi:hypothetical protein